LRPDDLFVCAVCHSDLRPGGGSHEAFVACIRCERTYRRIGDVYSMIPRPIPDESVSSRWLAWETVQNNGLRSYLDVPEFNLSVGPRPEVLAFNEFCRPAGLILDVGCGPQRLPSYVSSSAEVVGIDPLLGDQPREFAFVQGIGEYLPFRVDTFDQILYATSLDHVLDALRSLAEAERCLKPDGRINLWLDSQPRVWTAPPSSRVHRYGLVALNGLRSLARNNWLGKVGLTRTLRYIAAVARMTVPRGAFDCFHLQQLNVDSLAPWFEGLGLRITRREQLRAADSVFIEVTRSQKVQSLPMAGEDSECRSAG